MATAINNRERLPKLELQPNVPVTVALKFKGPRETDFGVMFTTDQGPLFLSLEEGSQLEHAIQEAGIRTGEPFLLTKLKFGTARGGGFSYRADRIGAGSNEPGVSEIERQLARSIIEAERKKAGVVTPASQSNQKPTAKENGVQPVQVNGPTITPTSARLCACLKAAIDAQLEAMGYATRLGWDLQFSNEDVRCMAISTFINGGK